MTTEHINTSLCETQHIETSYEPVEIVYRNFNGIDLSYDTSSFNYPTRNEIEEAERHRIENNVKSLKEMLITKQPIFLFVRQGPYAERLINNKGDYVYPYATAYAYSRESKLRIALEFNNFKTVCRGNSVYVFPRSGKCVNHKAVSLYNN